MQPEPRTNYARLARFAPQSRRQRSFHSTDQPVADQRSSVERQRARGELLALINVDGHEVTKSLGSYPRGIHQKEMWWHEARGQPEVRAFVQFDQAHLVSERLSDRAQVSNPFGV